MTNEIERGADAERVAEDLVSGQLDGYMMPKPKAAPAASKRAVWDEPMTDVVPLRPGYGPGMRRMQERREYVARMPAVETPSVFTKAKVDEALRALAGRPGIDGMEAVYRPEDWDVLVSEVTGYLLDVVEGAGLVVKSRFAGGVIRAAVGQALLEQTQHWGSDDRYRKIVVLPKERLE